MGHDGEPSVLSGYQVPARQRA